jgi:beta-glucosidase/6-phospho-beta-glucosidase/beta-galactosidase
MTDTDTETHSLAPRVAEPQAQHALQVSGKPALRIASKAGEAVHTPQTAQRPREVLFPEFLLAGYECSTHVNRRGERQDLVSMTQHDRFLEEDYSRLSGHGFRTVREGVPWYRIDRGGRYDFRPVAPFVDAGMRHGLTQIWDLFHYGFPTHLDPFREDFVARFADYCNAFARYLMRRTGDTSGAVTRFYTPVNEPSFYCWAAGEVGWFAPFERDKGFELKLQLVKACIAGINAIRDADPGARMVNVDPAVHVVAPADEPGLADDAERFSQFQWQFWDMVVGKEWPQLGGSPAHLDIVGVNHYLSGQWEHCRGTELGYEDPRRKTFSRILADVAARYPDHPILISETSCWGHMRPIWMDHVVDEALIALREGVNLQGVCLYPIVDMPDWHAGHFIEYGLWDLVPEGDTMVRRLNVPYAEAIERGRRKLLGSGLVATDPITQLVGVNGAAA